MASIPTPRNGVRNLGEDQSKKVFADVLILVKPDTTLLKVAPRAHGLSFPLRSK